VQKMIIIEQNFSTTASLEKAFLYQRLSVMIQRYNAIAILGTFANTNPEDEFYTIHYLCSVPLGIGG